jgi:hypothetical protein
MISSPLLKRSPSSGGKSERRHSMVRGRITLRITGRRWPAIALALACLFIPATVSAGHGQTDPPQVQRIKEAIRSIGLEPRPSGYGAANGILNFDVVAGPGGTLKPGEMRSSVGICVSDTKENLMMRLNAAGLQKILAESVELDLGASQRGTITAKPATYSDGKSGWKASASVRVSFLCENVYVDVAASISGATQFSQDQKDQAQGEALNLSQGAQIRAVDLATKLAQAFASYQVCQAAQLPPPVMDPYVTIIAMDGDVSAKKGLGDWRECQVGQKLGSDIELHTGPESSVTLQYPDGHILVVKQLTQLMIGTLLVQADRFKIELLLYFGEIKASTPHRETVRSGFSIRTPVLCSSVRGTVFSVSHDAKTETTTVSVEEGEVLVTPTNTALSPLTLSKGEGVRVTMNGVEKQTPPEAGVEKEPPMETGAEKKAPPETGRANSVFPDSRVLRGIGAVLLVAVLVVVLAVILRARRRRSS